MYVTGTERENPSTIHCNFHNYKENDRIELIHFQLFILRRKLNKDGIQNCETTEKHTTFNEQDAGKCITSLHLL